MWLSDLADITEACVLRERKKEQKPFNKKIRMSSNSFQGDVFVFWRGRNTQDGKALFNLASIADDPNKVVPKDDKTVTVKIESNNKRFSRDRLVIFPV